MPNLHPTPPPSAHSAYPNTHPPTNMFGAMNLNPNVHAPNMHPSNMHQPPTSYPASNIPAGMPVAGGTAPPASAFGHGAQIGSPNVAPNYGNAAPNYGNVAPQYGNVAPQYPSTAS